MSLAVLAFLGAVIGFACFFSSDPVLLVFNKVVACLFVADVIVRIISGGIEDYIDGEWNGLDVTMIFLNLVFTVIVEAHTLSALFKIVRLFRVFAIFKLLFKSECFDMEFEML